MPWSHEPPINSAKEREIRAIYESMPMHATAPRNANGSVARAAYRANVPLYVAHHVIFKGGWKTNAITKEVSP